MKLTAKLTGAREAAEQLKRIGESPRLALDRLVEQVEEYVGEQVGKHTRGGALFASLIKRRLVGGGWEVGHDAQRAPHALWVHWPTRPHKIMPKNKLALRWATDGKAYASDARGTHFRFSKKGVNHPGYKGDPWFARAAAQAPLLFQAHVKRVLAEQEGSQR